LTAWARPDLGSVLVTLRLTDAGKSGIGPRDVGVRRSPVVFECGTVLLVAVETEMRACLANDVGGLARDDGGRDLITGGVSRRA
jgi:hypothetical protein